MKDSEVIDSFASLHQVLADWIKKREDGLAIETLYIVRFVVACYDKESPVAHQHKSRWTQRKKNAADVAGLLNTEPKFKESVEAILYGKNDIINRIIIRYLSMLYDRDFMSYAIKSEILTKQSEQLINFDYDKPQDMSKAMDNVESLQKDLDRLEEKIFSGGDVVSLKNVLYEDTHRFMVEELRPENIVTKLERGEPVVDINPYEEGYKIPKMKYIGDS